MLLFPEYPLAHNDGVKDNDNVVDVKNVSAFSHASRVFRSLNAELIWIWPIRPENGLLTVLVTSFIKLNSKTSDWLTVSSES